MKTKTLGALMIGTAIMGSVVEAFGLFPLSDRLGVLLCGETYKLAPSLGMTAQGVIGQDSCFFTPDRMMLFFSILFIIGVFFFFLRNRR